MSSRASACSSPATSTCSEFPEFQCFSDRVETHPAVDWRLLPAEIARADINLIPLKINVFTEGKSNLKYYEAALLKIPSVASPTGVYSSCITHGVNGFLARSHAEWYEALRSLIVDPALREQMGERAHRHVLGTYVPQVIGDEAAAVYRQLLLEHRLGLGITEESPTVVVLVGDLVRALRDRAPAITLARELTQAGAQRHAAALGGAGRVHRRTRAGSGSTITVDPRGLPFRLAARSPVATSWWQRTTVPPIGRSGSYIGPGGPSTWSRNMNRPTFPRARSASLPWRATIWK